MADDLGYGDLGCYGQTRIPTPNIDRLAREGLRFTQFYAGSTVCAPSRSSLMTGLHTGHAPIRGNKEVQPEGQSPLPSGSVTLAELLHAEGYVTGAFGKWGLGAPGSEGDPIAQGFDAFYGYNCQRLAHNYYPDHLWDDTSKVRLTDNAEGAFGTYAPQRIHEKALEFV
ncbi:MAG: sulfatase-like hydrolase/transferase, partial [Saprospiraceae bacterium]|nr:sulfatase-like hydrolase/transferase [Saprospiraceae bacterium]